MCRRFRKLTHFVLMPFGRSPKCVQTVLHRLHYARASHADCLPFACISCALAKERITLGEAFHDYICYFCLDWYIDWCIFVSDWYIDLGNDLGSDLGIQILIQLYSSVVPMVLYFGLSDLHDLIFPKP